MKRKPTPTAKPGQYIVVGHGSDADYGRVYATDDGSLMVAWLGSAVGCRTPCNLDLKDGDAVYETAREAEADVEGRLGTFDFQSPD